MRNLARNLECDTYIREELNEARVPIRRLPCVVRDEVPFQLIGELGPIDDQRQPAFLFRRAWYYWVALGKVPIHVAKKLYEHPVGRKDIRVSGHCGRPPPADPWVTYLDSQGRQVVVLSDRDRELIDRHKRGDTSGAMVDTVERMFREMVFTNTREEQSEKAAEVFVDTYHIDSQEGLNLFVGTLKAEKVDGYYRTIDRLSELLTGTANALKGEPPELTSHSWHDLPELAAELAKVRDDPALQDLLRSVRDWMETDDPGGSDIIESAGPWIEAGCPGLKKEK